MRACRTAATTTLLSSSRYQDGHGAAAWQCAPASPLSLRSRVAADGLDHIWHTVMSVKQRGGSGAPAPACSAVAKSDRTAQTMASAWSTDRQQPELLGAQNGLAPVPVAPASEPRTP